MAAKDETINVPVVTGTGSIFGPGIGGLQAPAAAADSLLLPEFSEIFTGKVTPQQQERLLIREQLLKNARENLGDILTTAETRYSRDLAALQTSLNAYLKNEPGQNTCAIYLDPAKFDAAMALGFAETTAIGQVLARQGLVLNPDLWEDKFDLDRLSNGTMDRHESRFGIHIYTQGGASYGNVGKDRPTNVIIPSTDHALPSPIEGLSRKDDIDFINRHEGWHAKDRRYQVNSSDPEIMKKIKNFDLALLSSDEGDDVRAAYVSKHRDEAIADVGALGDMIRAGKPVSVIDAVRAWRKGDPDDHRHMSVLALDGLKAEIEKMGVDKFRKLDDRTARAKYYDIVEDYGVNEASVKVAALYDISRFIPEVLKELEEKAKTDPDTAKGLAFYGLVGDAATRPAEGNPLKPGEDAIRDSLAKWDAMQVLQDRAFRDSGRITPATLVKAYTALKEGLEDKMDAEPDNHLHDLKLSKLKASYIDNVPKIDYVEANKRFGVDIVAVEPSLERYKPAARSATLQPPKPGS